jgi:outer membrane receptor protein involved in Fe transport
LTVSVRRIDDRVAFYLPAPLRLSDNGDPEAIPGYDAGRGALVGPDLIGFNPSPTQGPVAPDFTAQDGTRVRLTQATVTAAAPLEGDWRLYAGLRVRASQTERNGLFPRSPQTLNSRLEPALAAARVEFDAVDSVRAQVVSTGEPWGGEDLIVLEAIASSIAAPLDEALFSARVDGGVRTGGAHHRLGVGVYAARSEAGFQRAASLALLQARENAALLDLVALDAAGAPIAALTDGGVVRYGVQYDNANGQQTAFAAFGTWEASLGPRWTLDAGLRWDFARQSGMVESALPVDLRGPTPADDAVLVGTGVLRPFEADFDGWNGTAGARLALGDGASVFARASRAARLPSLSVFYGDPTGAAAIVATTQSLDVGLSWERPRFALYAVAFRTRFDGFPFDETVIDPATSAVRSRVAFASSETIGLEIEGETRPIEGLRLQATVTLQEPQFNRFALNAVQSGQATMMDLSGRQLVRVPRVMARGAATTALVGDAGQAGLVVEHYGERFADAANRVRLPAFTVVSAHLRVRLGEGATLSLHGANLTNSLGLTEGNPRSGQIESLDYNQRLFAARPIFGRTFSAELAFRY